MTKQIGRFFITTAVAGLSPIRHRRRGDPTSRAGCSGSTLHGAKVRQSPDMTKHIGRYFADYVNL